MIIDDFIKVNLNPSNINRYKKLGYLGVVGDEIDVKFEDLSKGSNSIIEVSCDVCGVHKKIKYNQLVKFGYMNHYFCKICKNKKNLLEKYGVENVFQLESVKEKSKKTNLEKRGVDNVSKNEKIKEQKRKTCEKNFGTEQPLSSQLIINKSIKTLIEKYGVDNISKVEQIKRKKENTCFKNNGVKYISQSNDFKIKIKKNILNFLKNKYGVIDYSGEDYIFFCNNCNKNFNINKRAFQTRRELNVETCTFCNPIGSFSISGEEKRIMEYVTEIYCLDIINNNKKIIPPQEIDIYLPDLKLAFEFNGLYWHSELYKSSNYHLNKTEMCEKQGIKLIHIYEDDWLYKQNIVKSRILNLLGKSEKIFARKCEIKEISNNKLIREFLDQNHLQGFIGSKIKIGLFYNEELMSLMTFGNFRSPMGQKSIEGSYEMLRFCNKLNINIVGGASRLFKYFINHYKPIKIISYADRSWSSGELYEKLEFELSHKTQPNYYYIIDGIRKYRFNYRKDKLIKEGYDPNKTEHEIMLDREIYRIYDSGSLKFIYKNL